MVRELKVGDFAPDFTLRNQHGELVRLSEFRNVSTVVLYFYPKDDTPGCTVQACGFRDHYNEFADYNAVILGISSDSGSSHIKFAAKHNLPFTLLTDSDSKVRKLYGVPKSFLFIPGRLTYVIDKEGVIQHIFNSQINAGQHIHEALTVVKQLG